MQTRLGSARHWLASFAILKAEAFQPKLIDPLPLDGVDDDPPELDVPEEAGEPEVLELEGVLLVGVDSKEEPDEVEGVLVVVVDAAVAAGVAVDVAGEVQAEASLCTPVVEGLEQLDDEPVELPPLLLPMAPTLLLPLFVTTSALVPERPVWLVVVPPVT